MYLAAPSSPLLTNRPFSSPTLHLYSIQRLWSAARRPQIQTVLSHAYGQRAGCNSLSQPQREKVLSRFKDDPSVRVLLVSLRAGGVGLNLVAAQTVYLMDPWWNPAVEEQAINRVHRIGQAYPVKVKRYLMQQSVEDRILELQSKKSALVKGALGGTSAEESKAMRVEDLKWLFSK